MRRTAVSALLVLLLVSGLCAPLTRVVGKRSAFSAVATAPSKQDLILLTYHGSLEVGAEALAVQVLLHVLVKVKQRADGSFKVRTVTYAERPELAEGEDFAPSLTELSLTLEHEEGGAWQPLHLDELDVLQVQGPFVHEASVPENVAANELRLRIMDWPIFYTISLPKLADQNLYGPMLKDSGPFQNAMIPQYDVGFREWAAYDPTKLIAYNHAALMLWGERFHLSVLDIDELWSSQDEMTTVNTWFDRQTALVGAQT
ncbi:hypothetical protein WJX79_003205 [Trebouxia sp. C0005]